MKMKNISRDILLSLSTIALIKKVCSVSGLIDPVPGFLWGTSDSCEVPSIFLGVYERDGLPIDDPVYLVRTIDEIEIFVPQEELLNMLDGNSIDVVDGRLVIRQGHVVRE